MQQSSSQKYFYPVVEIGTMMLFCRLNRKSHAEFELLNLFRQEADAVLRHTDLPIQFFKAIRLQLLACSQHVTDHYIHPVTTKLNESHSKYAME